MRGRRIPGATGGRERGVGEEGPTTTPTMPGRRVIVESISAKTAVRIEPNLKTGSIRQGVRFGDPPNRFAKPQGRSNSLLRGDGLLHGAAEVGGSRGDLDLRGL